MLETGYSRIKTRDGRKFYGPAVNSLGKTLHLKAAQKTASDALAYAKRFVKKWTSLHAKKEISGDQS